MSEAPESTANPLAALRTGRDLDEKVFPPLAWAVEGMIPQGFGLFTGAPKVGKSWATLDVALAVASGTPAFGVVPTGQARPVLLLALEDGERRLQTRCRQLLGNRRIPPLLHYGTTMPVAEVLPLVDAFIGEYGPHNPLVIVDTLGRIMPPALPGESAYGRDYRIGARLKASADAQPGTCLLVVHHVRKAHGVDWMDSTSGTNGLNGAADWTLNISRDRNTDASLFRVTGRDVAEGEYALTMTNGAWRLDATTLAGAAAKARMTSSVAGLGDKSAEMVAFIAANPGCGPTQVGHALDMTANAAGAYLGNLERAGRLQKTGRGRYVLGTPFETFESVETEGDIESFPSISKVSTLSRPSSGPRPAQ